MSSIDNVDLEASNTEETGYTEDFTPAFYTMDPQTEDLLKDARSLQDGMVVLIEDHIVKVDIASKHELNEYSRHRALEMNRWCTVQDVELHYAGSNSLVSFVGVYADGTKRKRTMSASYAWFVKKDSLPKPVEKTYPEELKERQQAFRELLSPGAQDAFDVFMGNLLRPIEDEEVCHDRQAEGGCYGELVRVRYQFMSQPDLVEKYTAEDIKLHESAYVDMTVCTHHRISRNLHQLNYTEAQNA